MCSSPAAFAASAPFEPERDHDVAESFANQMAGADARFFQIRHGQSGKGFGFGLIGDQIIGEGGLAQVEFLTGAGLRMVRMPLSRAKRSA